MLTGVDTGFFFALQDRHPVAVNVWRERKIVTSSIVLYEIQKKLLQGHLEDWPNVIKDIEKSLEVVPLTSTVALEAAHIAHGMGMPGLDALILGSLVQAGCEEIYTTDSHFELYKNKETEIINLSFHPG